MSLDFVDINIVLMKLILILWIRKLKENFLLRVELIKVFFKILNRKFLV